ncbi:MAG: membrane protein required for colicin V production [Candidatus Azotimanducaceae bacterium]|jgi:membrane protein required for colicin V production|tara:strand:- start:10110 stop:10631 length:522 start_codon:yes stop_codon:yes gene_type:complete
MNLDLDLANLDWVILGIIFVSTVLSAFRGLVREALALGSWILAVIVARWFVDPLSMHLSPYIEMASVRTLIAYGLLMVGTLMVCGLLTRVLGELIKISGLSATDRLLGMVFGFLRGALVVLLGVTALHYFTPVTQDPWWQSSRLVPLVLELLEVLKPMVLEHSDQLLRNLTEV